MHPCIQDIRTSFVDLSALQPLLNSRLIALDKNPGVRPIGIIIIILFN